MNHWRIIATIMTLAVLVLAAPSLVQAGSLPLPDQPQEPMGTEFTYQGYLTDGSAPAEGVYDFQFTLHSAETLGLPLGTLPLDDVSVTNGYFTVTLDFGAGMFAGNPRWLGIAVRPGEETGDYTMLTPRQALTAAPYALYADASPWAGLTGIPAGFADGTDADTTYTAGTGLSLTDTAFSVNFGGNGAATTASHSDHIHSTYWRTTGNSQTDPATDYIGTMDDVALVFRVNAQPALRLEPHATSPNIIGGYSGNSVLAGQYGATIGGGGASGLPNQVLGNYSTVGGGVANTASYHFATVGGGELNLASNVDATVGGGYSNTASGERATVGGGGVNTASDYGTTVSGGNANTASNLYATVSGGYSNTAGGERATVSGGFSNTASGNFATVPGGYYANASHYGQMAYASGRFASNGDAQSSLYVLRETSTGTAWTGLFLDGYAERITLASGQVMSFDILIVGGTDAGESAGYRIQGVIENIGGVTALVGTPVVTVLAEEDTAWDVSVAAEDGNDALYVQARGNTGDTVRWVASVQTAEVTWP